MKLDILTRLLEACHKNILYTTGLIPQGNFDIFGYVASGSADVGIRFDRHGGPRCTWLPIFVSRSIKQQAIEQN